MKSSRHSIGNGSSGFERLGEKELWKANVSAKTLTSRRKLSRALLAIVTSTTRAGSEKATAVAHAAGVSPATTCVAIARTTTIVRSDKRRLGKERASTGRTRGSQD